MLFNAQFLLTNILVVGFQAYPYPLSLKKKWKGTTLYSRLERTISHPFGLAPFYPKQLLEQQQIFLTISLWSGFLKLPTFVAVIARTKKKCSEPQDMVLCLPRCVLSKICIPGDTDFRSKKGKKDNMPGLSL